MYAAPFQDGAVVRHGIAADKIDPRDEDIGSGLNPIHVGLRARSGTSEDIVEGDDDTERRYP